MKAWGNIDFPVASSPAEQWRRAPLLTAPPGEQPESDQVRRIERLERRVRELEQALGVGSEVDPLRDPYLTWCEDHQRELREYPFEFAVVDMQAGKILFGAHTREELSRRYREIPREERRHLYKTHTFKSAKG